jgi:hypothetical protein
LVEPVERVVEESPIIDTTNINLSPAELRSRADALYKEAAKLRKEADEKDPPKVKKQPTKETT